jgi:hypothetical protein
MSQLVKTKRQASFKDFKRFGAFKGIVEQKTLYSTRSCVNWAFFGTLFFYNIFTFDQIDTNHVFRIAFKYSSMISVHNIYSPNLTLIYLTIK